MRETPLIVDAFIDMAENILQAAYVTRGMQDVIVLREQAARTVIAMDDAHAMSSKNTP